MHIYLSDIFCGSIFGYPAIPLPHHSIVTTTMLTHTPFTCSGQLTSLNYYSANHNQLVIAIVRSTAQSVILEVVHVIRHRPVGLGVQNANLSAVTVEAGDVIVIVASILHPAPLMHMTALDVNMVHTELYFVDTTSGINDLEKGSNISIPTLITDSTPIVYAMYFVMSLEENIAEKGICLHFHF